MNPERTDLNDLAAIARTTKSAHYRRALSDATSEIEFLRARVKELEGMIDWHIDMVVGDAWLCRIEGKFEDIDRLLGNAVGKEIQAYEIDTSHHENTHE
jgi:hypothetical protein